MPFGTKTGALTACAGSAALGVGESGGLEGHHDIQTHYLVGAFQFLHSRRRLCRRLYDIVRGSWRLSTSECANLDGGEASVPVDDNRYSLYLGIYMI